MPVAFSGLSDSFTAGRPSTEVTLQTIEIGSRSADPSGAQPTKSLVRVRPHPKVMRTRAAARGEGARSIGRPADEIIGEVGPPAKADADAAGEMAVGLLDRADIHAVGKHQ